MINARETHKVIPAFNIPYIPMMEPVVSALKDTGTFGLIAVARLEWVKFSSGSIEEIAKEYNRIGNTSVTSLHLDHVPVIDEDLLLVDYVSDIKRALEAGYSSVMVDASRLPLEENIQAVRKIVELSHAAGASVEAELGAVMGHEKDGVADYDELFESGKGFTDIDEAKRLVDETGLDWLSVAVGSVHGAITAAARKQKKVTARLNIEHLDQIDNALNIPLVLHGGSGIALSYLKESFNHGIAKLNIATDIRQPYEALKDESMSRAKDAVYKSMLKIIENLGIRGSAKDLLGE
jgi:ketose-bisphosphate aldolase